MHYKRRNSIKKNIEKHSHTINKQYTKKTYKTWIKLKVWYGNIKLIVYFYLNDIYIKKQAHKVKKY